MELDDIRSFVRIAELKNISAAARTMKAPKSSISRSLARLEVAVGTELVGRSTRHLRLTDAGELFYPHALRILSEVDDAESQLQGFTGVARGLIRVTAPFAFAQGLIAPMLPAFLARHPEVQIQLDADNRLMDVLPEGADLVIHRGPLAETARVARVAAAGGTLAMRESGLHTR